MGIYVYGAGKIGARVRERLEDYKLPMDGYIDTYKSGSYMGKPIIDIDHVNADDTVIISVLNTNSILKMYETLKRHGIKIIYWFYDICQKQPSGEAFFEDQCLNMSDWGDSVMPHIEFHVSDKCNLNCKGCTHFSPLFDSINAVFEEKMKDIRKVKRLFDDIFRLDILGGEPLLNPELKRYVSALRKELPRTFIQIYTNGLLIPSMDDDLLMAIHDSNVFISISEYWPTYRMIDQIEEKLDQFHIRYHIAGVEDKQVFNKPISTSNKSRYPNMCISNGCITVSDGKIARCPTLMYVHQFNNYFHQQLPTEGIYEIDKYTDGRELLENMKKEVPLCKHCIKCDMKWEVCGKNIKFEDFATNE